MPKYDIKPKKVYFYSYKGSYLWKAGNGVERKKKLKETGYNYTEVQKKVNELLK